MKVLAERIAFFETINLSVPKLATKDRAATALVLLNTCEMDGPIKTTYALCCVSLDSFVSKFDSSHPIVLHYELFVVVPVLSF